MRSFCHLRTRDNGTLELGQNVSLNYGDMLVCYEKIQIGNDVQFGPNVLVYDHDYDFWAEGNLKVVILRGTTISEDCVIGAGSVVKSKGEAGMVLVRKQ